MSVTVRRQLLGVSFLLLQKEFQELNSGYQVRWQVHLPASSLALTAIFSAHLLT